MVSADGYVMLSTPAEKIEANVSRVREARARGASLLDLMRAGALD